MDEILTNDELDALLTAISSSTSDKIEEEIIEPKKIRTYDFKKPDKFSKDHLKSFQHIFETFTRMASPALSLKYESPISFHISSLDQLSYEEFSKLIPENSILGMVNLKPLLGFTIFEFEPALTFSMIDLLLGGKGDFLNQSRELTDLELPIIQNIMQNLVSFMRDAFQSIIQIKPSLEKIETNSFFKQKLHSSEIILQVCIDVKVKEMEHSINICIPYSSLEPVIHKFSNKNLDSLDEANKDISQNERKKKILDACLIRTYSEFQAGTVFIQPNGENEDIFHEVNIHLTSDTKSNHFFKTIFKNFVRSTEAL
jgi:flagellar motor switch protein FliM